MRDFIDVTGKSEDEAIQNALRQLNMDRDDVSVEVLERAKSGFLGLGSCPAKIRVYYGPEEEEEAKPVPKTVSPAPEKPVPPKPEHPRRERQEKPKPAEKLKRPEPVRREEPVEKPAAREKEEPAAVPVNLGEEVNDEKAQAIRVFLSGLLEHMEAQAEIRVYQPEKGRYKVILEGKNMGGLIGRRGETLDAIQQLTSYCVNRSGGGRVRVQLDAEGYREKREQSLQHLARKVAGKVVKYRRSVTLEPMNAYERHVIHTALQEVPGVTTYSTGAEPNRRVIVAYDRAEG